MISLIEKLDAIVDGNYVDLDDYKEIVEVLTEYEFHRTDLNSEAVLWLAALYEVPIENRIEWVAEMHSQLEKINKMRRELLGNAAPTP